VATTRFATTPINDDSDFAAANQPRRARAEGSRRWRLVVADFNTTYHFALVMDDWEQLAAVEHDPVTTTPPDPSQ
jgi:hypothetical protein